MKTCRTCAHWRDTERYSAITDPIDPDTYKPMETAFDVRKCHHPKLLFCERPLESNGFAVVDGSTYYAALYTAEDFGCIRHEESA